jgi:TIR domain
MAHPTPTAFFSYSRDDSDFALRLAKDLRAAGSIVWLDQLDIHAGERWDRSVENALNECPRMLVILSPSSVASNNVMDEVSFALEEKKTVIPILYRDCKIPFRLRRVQYIDCRSDYDRGLRELVSILEGEVSATGDVAPLAERTEDEAAEVRKRADQELRDREAAEAKKKADQELRDREAAEAKKKADQELRDREAAEAKRKADQELRDREAAEDKWKADQELRDRKAAEAKWKADQELRDREAAEAKKRADQELRDREAAEAKKKAARALAAELAGVHRRTEDPKVALGAVDQSVALGRRRLAIGGICAAALVLVAGAIISRSSSRTDVPSPTKASVMPNLKAIAEVVDDP